MITIESAVLLERTGCLVIESSQFMECECLLDIIDTQTHNFGMHFCDMSDANRSSATGSDLQSSGGAFKSIVTNNSVLQGTWQSDWWALDFNRW
jgi:hypothetical protein